MTERYAFRYTEYLIGQKEESKIFADVSDENPLLADIGARFRGMPFDEGKAPLALFGIRVPLSDDGLQKLSADVADYGADALRVAILENKLPLTHQQKAAGWRLVGNLWHILKQHLWARHRIGTIKHFIRLWNLYSKKILNVRGLI